MTPRSPRSAWYRRALSLGPPPSSTPDPAADRAAGLAKFAVLAAADSELPEATRTKLVEPDVDAQATIVIWHGFTNAPSQFAAVADELGRLGYRVLVPRVPHHGLPDLLTRDLLQLSPAELVSHVDACLDIAEGFGDPIWVLGLSAGATLAGQAASSRSSVQRLVLVAPLVAPVGFPMPVVRLMVRNPRLAPKVYWWWDPRVKYDPAKSAYAYPGFPIPALITFLSLSEALIDAGQAANPSLERVVLVTNPADVAIRRDAARRFAEEVFGAGASYYGEATIDPALKWTHDFVDPHAPGTASTEQVVAILTAALGVGEPGAGGVLVEPLVQSASGGGPSPAH